ncbi:MAG TPA: SxtJ family membrane protein [Pyrinomonadaceae bacterium]|nr:SxtJ family membrane protein [Pyrinomonadaceae bacterium]
MFQHVQWQPDSRELRRFAVAMLVGFTILGLIAAWRTNNLGTFPLVLWSLGIGLAVAALVPGLGRAAYLAVYLPTSIIGYIVSHVILFLMFFLVFVPIGLILRLTGKDLLRLRPQGSRAVWMHMETKKHSDSYYRQF